MIFKVARLVSEVSQYMTLLPGDVIATGTPSEKELEITKKILEAAVKYASYIPK